jgi:hypothetical protein
VFIYNPQDKKEYSDLVLEFTAVDREDPELECFYRLDRGEWKKLSTISKSNELNSLSIPVTDMDPSKKHKIAVKCSDGKTETPEPASVTFYLASGESGFLGLIAENPLWWLLIALLVLFLLGVIAVVLRSRSHPPPEPGKARGKNLFENDEVWNELNARADQALEEAKTGRPSKEIMDELVTEGYSKKEINIIKQLFREKKAKGR